MASDGNHPSDDDLRYILYRPDIRPEPWNRPPTSAEIELTVTFQPNLESEQIFRQSRRFELHDLNNQDRASFHLVPMLSNVGVNPRYFTSTDVVENVVRNVRRVESHFSGRGSSLVFPMHLDIYRPVLLNIDSEEDSDLEEMRSAWRESMRSEFERSNYNMVPAKESSVKKMVKRVRVEVTECDETGRGSTKKRWVQGEDCTICLEELEVVSEVSQIPCSHAFHGDCIEKWLKVSHYCPLCRFEMPIQE